MAKFELSNKQEYDDNHDQYTIKVVADLGDDATDTQEQSVLLPKKGAEEAAQKYADEMETELKKNYDAQREAEKQSTEA